MAQINHITLNFDSNITEIKETGFSKIVTTSGQSIDFPGTRTEFSVTLTDGYVLNTVVASSGTISDITSNRFKWTFGDNANITITLTSKVATVKKSVDLTTLPGWANLSAGNHTIKIKAKGTGYRESELSAGVTVSKAASTVTLEAGTYKFIDSPTAPVKNFQQIPLVFRSYNAGIDGLTQYTLISVYLDSGSTSVFTIEYEGDETEPQTAFYDGAWGKEDNKYKIITLSTDQQVSAEFYKWAITDGNLVKQIGYNLTINYSTVPMSTGAAYIKINSDTVSSSNYDYVVQPGTSSTNPTLKNSAGTTLTVPYVVPNVEKVAFMGGLAIAVNGSTTKYTSPYTLTADTTISPGVYGPTADTPIDEPTI
nr:MAG TPA: hypothetical protein [Caudoviricetes sp.]